MGSSVGHSDGRLVDGGDDAIRDELARALRPTAPEGSTLTVAEVLSWSRAANNKQVPLNLLGYDLTGSNFSGTALTRVIFGWHDSAMPAARLQGAWFQESTLRRCYFTGTDLSEAKFRGCEASSCDFRYATFRGTSLQGATLSLCDLYRATVGEGTVLLDTTFELVSMPATLDRATGLRWASFARRRGKPPALVAESEPVYRRFLEATKHDRPRGYSIDRGLDDRLKDAARCYRDLCGLWTVRGQFGDAADAYVHSRRLERQEAGPLFKGKPFNPLRWLGLWCADVLCGFGESLWKVAAWLVVIALLPGVIYAIAGDVVHGSGGLRDDLLFSASQLTASTPQRLSSTSHAVEWVRVIQTLAGVAMLGLLGFVLGNKLRNS